MEQLQEKFKNKFPAPNIKMQGLKVKKGFDHKQVLSKMFEDNHLDNAFIEDDPNLSP